MANIGVGYKARVFLNDCLGDDLSNIEGISKLGFNSAQNFVARIRSIYQKENWEWILLRALNSVVLQLKIIFTSTQLNFYGCSPLGLRHEFISRCGDNCCATCRNNKVAYLLHSLNCVCLIMTLIVNIQISD
jgi:hypothetical protein